MRAAPWLLVLLALPSASAMGIGLAPAALQLDAPLLEPLEIRPPPPARATEPPAASPAAAPAAPAIDPEDLHAPTLAFELEPPRSLTGPPAAGRLARMDSHEATLARRAPVRAPEGPPAPQPHAPAPTGPETEAPAGREPDAPRAPAPGRPGAEARPRAPAAPSGEAPAWPTLAASAGALLAILAPVLYHRLRGPSVVESGMRRTVLTTLGSCPGMTASELARALELDPSTAAYHLRRLEKEGFVTCERHGRRQRFFSAGATGPEARLASFLDPTSRGILETVRHEPGVSVATLLASADISRTVLTWHVQRLARLGLVRREPEGRVVRLFPITFS